MGLEIARRHRLAGLRSASAAAPPTSSATSSFSAWIVFSDHWTLNRRLRLDSLRVPTLEFALLRLGCFGFYWLGTGGSAFRLYLLRCTRRPRRLGVKICRLQRCGRRLALACIGAFFAAR
jgi:hypothetical protein